jgi:transcriptional regulator with XRE-family HTH domain
MITRHQLMEAVRCLRQHFGDTQQQFASRMKTAVITIARWETSRAPSGPALEKLCAVAGKEGVSECERVFQDALAGNVEPAPARSGNRLDFVFQNSREKALALALVTMLRDPEHYAESLRSIGPMLENCLDSFKTTFDVENIDERIALAVVTLHGKGDPPERIATELGVGVEAIKKIVAFDQFDLITPRWIVQVHGTHSRRRRRPAQAKTIVRRERPITNRRSLVRKLSRVLEISLQGEKNQ